MKADTAAWATVRRFVTAPDIGISAPVLAALSAVLVEHDTAKPALWNYQARTERIVDGDTMDTTIDIGFRLTTEQRLRFLGINTPELHAAAPSTRLAAKAAAAAVLGWTTAAAASDVTERWPLIVHTEKADSFGRYLADVTTRDGLSLNQFLLDQGLAIPYVR